MIPIYDTTPSKTRPLVNNALIGLNILGFLIQMAHGGDLARFIYIYGVVPARYTAPEIARYFSFFEQLLPFVSFMFLHGGFLHILGNMWFLYIFGDNVEDHLGPVRYLVFYLACGIASGLSHVALNLYSNVPTIGASGAIAGVMGAYFLLYPGARILTLIPIIFIPYFVEIPAFFFLAIWFFLQFLNATGGPGDVSGVAWWAHVGGFLFGLIFLKAFDAVPPLGLRDRLRPVTSRRRSRQFQHLKPDVHGEDLDLHATLAISPYESAWGGRKLVNIPWGFQKRLFRVVIPPNTRDGTLLRLKGLGKLSSDGRRGDMMLRVVVQE